MIISLLHTIRISEAKPVGLEHCLYLAQKIRSLHITIPPLYPKDCIETLPLHFKSLGKTVNEASLWTFADDNVHKFVTVHSHSADKIC